MKKYSTILLLFVTVIACEDEKVYKVDAELQPYVESFYSEALVRSKNLPKDNLIVELRRDVQAYYRTGNGEGQKYIHFSEQMFEIFSEQQREYYIFEAMAPIFTAKSLAGLINDMETEYSEETREEILNELFK